MTTSATMFKVSVLLTKGEKDALARLRQILKDQQKAK